VNGEIRSLQQQLQGVNRGAVNEEIPSLQQRLQGVNRGAVNGEISSFQQQLQGTVPPDPRSLAQAPPSNQFLLRVCSCALCE